jgi:DNA mismatch endonuclease (patch repair protein)
MVTGGRSSGIEARQIASPEAGVELVDIVDQATRSRMMAAIKGRDTAPEMRVRRALHASGLRFRLHAADLPGRPDIVLPSRMVALFVHGCFWHRHPGCRFATTPSTRPEFWAAKFAANVRRDASAQASLEARGWTVMTVWECEMHDESKLASLAAAIRSVPATRSRSKAIRRPVRSP